MIIGYEADGVGDTIALGSLQKGGAVPPTGDESWVIGSDSKTITALILGELVSSGKLALDRPLQQLLPAGWTVPNGPGGQSISLENLLVHASGLPRYPATLQREIDAARGLAQLTSAWTSYTLDQLRADLAQTVLASTPGTTYAYSDFGFALAQQVAENSTGMSYPTLLANLGSTLGWRGTFAPQEVAAAAVPIMTGYGGPALQPVPIVAPPVFVGDGFIYSNAADLRRLIRVLANLDPPPTAAVGQSIALIEQPYFARTVGALTVHQGLGLGIVTAAGFTLDKKDGSSSGTSTVLIYDPEHHLGVVIGASVGMLSDLNRAGCQVLAAVGAQVGVTYPADLLAACETGF
jgi:CubicO group peptidase (beta-lactamase class C family)